MLASLPAAPLKRTGLLFTFTWFIVGGLGHFVVPDFFVSICPPWVPEPLRVVYLSGLVEIALALQLIPRRSRSAAGYALLALIVAVTPVHIWMLMVPERFPQFPVALLWLRLLIQAAFIVNVWWSTRPDPT
ncbi:MAG: hypothetical protein NTZ11_07300 [Gammaproteobacteria bacterium]|nr:hypothetical protein [Gammaproteobacteria bacterium]